jgi:hypothetical protein
VKRLELVSVAVLRLPASDTLADEPVKSVRPRTKSV